MIQPLKKILLMVMMEEIIQKMEKLQSQMLYVLTKVELLLK
jgi:hypothetical protein